MLSKKPPFLFLKNTMEFKPGDKHEELTLLHIDENINDKYGNTWWMCKCSCGNKCVVKEKAMKRKQVFDCERC